MLQALTYSSLKQDSTESGQQEKRYFTESPPQVNENTVSCEPTQGTLQLNHTQSSGSKSNWSRTQSCWSAHCYTAAGWQWLSTCSSPAGGNIPGSTAWLIPREKEVTSCCTHCGLKTCEQKGSHQCPAAFPVTCWAALIGKIVQVPYFIVSLLICMPEAVSDVRLCSLGLFCGLWWSTVYKVSW